MTQPNEQLTETIEKALASSTQGKWLKDPGDHIDNPSAVYIIEPDGINATVIADNLLGVDAELIANTPEWLRALLEVNKRLRFGSSPIEPLVKLQLELQQTREELERAEDAAKSGFVAAVNLKSKCAEIQTELEQVKAERDQEKKLTELFDQRGEVIENQLDIIESLRTELEEKDKVLRVYADEDMYMVLHLGCTPKVMADRGRQACTILSQYEVTK